MTWKADQLQMVLFPLQGAKQATGLDLWNIISGGVPPDAFQKQNGLPGSVSLTSGEIGQYQVALSTQLGRIDLGIQPTENEIFEDEPPYIRDLEAGLAFIKDKACQIADSSSWSRFAIVTQLTFEANSSESAIEILNRHTQARFPEGSIDNILQFNIRKKFEEAPFFEMNRLCTWSKGIRQQFTSVYNGNNPTAVSMPVRTAEIAVLKIDVNSATTNDVTPYRSILIDEISKELASLAHQYTADPR